MNQDVNDTNDPLVSSAYRDSATETAPDALNQSVLREARRQVTSGGLYARSVFWLRPMAWAATIGLCLAIVVDLSDVPRPEPGLMPSPATTSPDANSLEEIVVEAEQDAAKESPPPEESNMAQRARKSVDEEGRVTLNNVPQLEKAESQTLEPEPAALGAVAAELGPFAPAPATGEAGLDTPAFEMSDQDIVAEAEELARQREGKNIRSQTSGFAVSSAPALEAAMEMPCDAAARKTPQSWLACIEGLETDGLNDLAAWQRDELHSAFPEFELP